MLLTLGILILLCPLTAAVVAGCAGPRILKGRTHWVVIGGVAAAALCAVLLFLTLRRSAEMPVTTRTISVYEWISSGANPLSALADQPTFNVNFLIDPLSTVMLMMVTCVATLIVVYSREYMRHDDHPVRGYERFFAYLGLFVFAMCALVLGGNFLLLYLGWEAVGLCSYLLIGFYYWKPSAAAAAKKAFLVNRVGDFGFGLGILLIYLTIGHLDYQVVFDAVRAAFAADGHGDPHALTAALNVDLSTAWEMLPVIRERTPVIALLLFCGALGKSAQLPLHVWLPDAMEGPSPVSALIHAATMVTAGVYMVARCGTIFAANHAVMTFVACIGAATALFAATIALTQYDMKRILAYSTISQLGYMFLGVGVYAADAAIFHLITHAFFKALLFLAAGSVMHAMGGIIDVREFGGLRKIMPWTCWTFVIGAAALAGLPLLSGFYSKDLILHHALQVHPLLGWIGVGTAALTAFYTFRMVFLAFWGELREPQGVSGHESGWWILGPLCALSVAALVSGIVLHNVLPAYLGPTFHSFGEALHHIPHTAVSASFVGMLSASLAVGGVLLAAVMYVALPELPQALRASWQRLFTVLHNKYYVDEGYDVVFVRPLRTTGQFLYAVDRFFIDGLVAAVALVPKVLGFVLRGLQQGALQGYGVTMATGLGLLLLLVLLYGTALAS